MAIKIEKKALAPVRQRKKGDWDEFLAAIQRMKVGESFQFDRCESNHRLAMAIAQRWLKAHFVVKREGDQFRIGRVA